MQEKKECIDKKEEQKSSSLSSGLFHSVFSSVSPDSSFRRGNAKIVIMRHAETLWNEPRKRIQGQSPNAEIELSEKGKQDIIRTLDSSKTPDLLILSPLHRCIQTAETWFGMQFKQIKTPTVFIEGLKEVNAGKLEGLYVDELSGEPEKIWNLWKNDPLGFPGFPDGETLEEFQHRVLQTFSELCNSYGDKPQEICIITHGGPMRVLGCFLNDKDLSHLWDHTVTNLERLELTRDQIIRLQNYVQENTLNSFPIL
ncbi:histidine phosphatase family protein [Legionella longbeachae]|uniref:Putative phosphoglycerate mutase family protein n=1 Tax=Legionella longbeachae serogroup 1 (strain NSW150) TaxID=661367 RepID=D3HLU9_LEGLN|nr:histidine phosphatase family protein [Legionella longbeachae]VEE03858.1 phosphoglycerate mutase [Legionella oakridgensis]HBD7397360.1 histidine phosphatase family protein [Legionella pneumophila]ARB93282.1 histidine phosphatase family protein [Legionella longbeachae]ARM33654.1 histidine phosphatase family protein [Legionella longbeachae]EEZ93507.1 phosphoglycerate mutase family protein [Legionella longbeachae D-4968]